MISEISTLCFFSLLCFGKLRIGPIDTSQCQQYDYLEDKISLNCNSSSLVEPYKSLKIHALAYDGTPLDRQETLVNMSFSHLIIRNAQFSVSSNLTTMGSVPDSVLDSHESLTIVRSSTITAWSWANFKFKHMYFEDCLLNSIDGETKFRVTTTEFLPATIRSLAMINCRIFSVGQGALGFLNSIETLTISHNQLTTFSRLALPEQAPNLWLIDLSNNKLASLDDYFTANLPSLRELNLQNNQFLTLPENFFTPLTSQTLLNLLDNSLTCDTFCWAFADIKPHPILLDAVNCVNSTDQEPVILAWTSADDIGCNDNRLKKCGDINQSNNTSN